MKHIKELTNPHGIDISDPNQAYETELLYTYREDDCRVSVYEIIPADDASVGEDENQP